MVSVCKRILYTRQQSLIKTKLKSTLDPQEDYFKRDGKHLLVILEMKSEKKQSTFENEMTITKTTSL